MAYYPSTTVSRDPSQAIYLYIVPLRNDFLNGSLKKPIKLFSHWAICIQGMCYELRAGVTKKGEPTFLYTSTPEQEWRQTRGYAGQEIKLVGYMAKPYPSWVIHQVASHIWDKAFKGNYVLDEKNCQTFAAVLVDSIGDPNTKAHLPQTFDKLVKTAGITRDISILGLATGAALMGVGLVTAVGDGGTTAAAGFAVASSTVFNASAALFSMRDGKAKHIIKAQKEIKEQLKKNHGVELP
ncbi:MAG: hypothetical protein M1823_001597 [Watsoniomyces obsoletus]|nr:MAG: hypothetical protein M1823_001597 [Watsoniomyces obsoletus]